MVKRCTKIVSSPGLTCVHHNKGSKLMVETNSRLTASVTSILSPLVKRSYVALIENCLGLGILNVLNQSELSTEEIWNVKSTYKGFFHELFCKGDETVFWGAI